MHVGQFATFMQDAQHFWKLVHALISSPNTVDCIYSLHERELWQEDNVPDMLNANTIMHLSGYNTALHNSGLIPRGDGRTLSS